MGKIQSQSLLIPTIFSLIIYLVVTKLFTPFFIKSGDKYANDQIISGTRLSPSIKATGKSVEKSKLGVSDIKIANVLPMPKFSVWQGILFHGSTGSGKTQGIMCLMGYLEGIRKPN